MLVWFWWFGIPGIPLSNNPLQNGDPENPNHRAPNQQLITSWYPKKNTFFDGLHDLQWLATIQQRFRKPSPGPFPNSLGINTFERGNEANEAWGFSVGKFGVKYFVKQREVVFSKVLPVVKKWGSQLFQGRLLSAIHQVVYSDFVQQKWHTCFSYMMTRKKQAICGVVTGGRSRIHNLVSLLGNWNYKFETRSKVIPRTPNNGTPLS